MKMKERQLSRDENEINERFERKVLKINKKFGWERVMNLKLCRNQRVRRGFGP